VVFYTIRCVANSNGLSMTCIRLAEPFVWTNLKTDLRKLFRCKKSEKQKRAKYSKESLDSFLNSAMNIEYVYLLLLGINFTLSNEQHLNPGDQEITIVNERDRSYIKFDKAKLKDPDRWNVT
jgi:hypothetical protein